MELEGKFSGEEVGFQNPRAVEMKGVKRLGGGKGSASIQHNFRRAQEPRNNYRGLEWLK